MGKDGKCDLHEHVIAQDCGEQLAWLKQTLAKVDSNDWVIGIGHHPAQEVDVEDLIGTLLAGGMRLYLDGHTHALSRYQFDGHTDVGFVTSGAGCMVHSSEEELESPQDPQAFDKRVSGFTVHSFAADFSTLTTDFYDAYGNVINTFETAKSSSGPSPSPSPGPSPLPPHPPPSPSPGPSPPSPSPAGQSCKVFGCGKFSREHTCQCNHNCKKYDDCCGDYDRFCGTDFFEIAV